MKRFSLRKSLARIASYGRRLVADPKLNWDDRHAHGHPGLFGDGVSARPPVVKAEVVRVGWDRISDPPTVFVEAVRDDGGRMRVTLEQDEHAELLRDLEYAGEKAFAAREDAPADDTAEDEFEEALAQVGVTGI